LDASDNETLHFDDILRFYPVFKMKNGIQQALFFVFIGSRCVGPHAKKPTLKSIKIHKKQAISQTKNRHFGGERNTNPLPQSEKQKIKRRIQQKKETEIA